MIKYPKITDISLVTDTISIYRKRRYLKCRYDTDILISAIYRQYFLYIDPPLTHTFTSIANEQINDEGLQFPSNFGRHIVT